MTQNKFIITKKIAKHRSQAVIVIPRLLQKILEPGKIAEITIEVIN
jgi:hypothetical protein